jgi:hypothetical protein
MLNEQEGHGNSEKNMARSPEPPGTDIKSMLAKLKRSLAVLEANRSTNGNMGGGAQVPGDLHQESGGAGELTKEELSQGSRSPAEPVDAAITTALEGQQPGDEPQPSGVDDSLPDERPPAELRTPGGECVHPPIWPAGQIREADGLHHRQIAKQFGENSTEGRMKIGDASLPPLKSGGLLLDEGARVAAGHIVIEDTPVASATAGLRTPGAAGNGH